MPVYNLPPEPKKKDDANETVSGSSPDSWDRTVRVPVNKAILEALKINDTVEITLIGKVTDLSSHESDEYNRRDLSIKVSRVSAYPEDERAEEDAMEREYNGE